MQHDSASAGQAPSLLQEGLSSSFWAHQAPQGTRPQDPPADASWLVKPEDAEPLRWALQDTTDWLERAVIGLNLCPFAKSVHVKGQIRTVASLTDDPVEVLEHVKRELQWLAAQPAELLDTTLLVFPCALPDFLDFNDWLDPADQILHQLGLEGELQIASFHPKFQFAETSVHDISNYTNRTPYPTLHLIREESLDRAVEAFPEAEAIFEANIDKLEEMGMPGWKALDIQAHVDAKGRCSAHGKD